MADTGACPGGRDHIAPLAVPLTRLGFAVWNLEYRRVRGARGELGAAGGGWPGTPARRGGGHRPPGYLGGERAGGARRPEPGVGRRAFGGRPVGAMGGRVRRRVRAATGCVWRLPSGWRRSPISSGRTNSAGGNGAVENLLGGSPEEYPRRYAEASPAERLPLGGAAAHPARHIGPRRSGRNIAALRPERLAAAV